MRRRWVYVLSAVIVSNTWLAISLSQVSWYGGELHRWRYDDMLPGEVMPSAAEIKRVEVINNRWQFSTDCAMIAVFASSAAALLFLAVPAVLAALRRQVRRIDEGQCPCCGYNLTGNTSGVCPECGTPTIAGVKA